MSLVTPVAISLLAGIPIMFAGFYFDWSALFMTFLMAVPGFLAIVIDVKRKELYFNDDKFLE